MGAYSWGDGHLDPPPEEIPRSGRKGKFTGGVTELSTWKCWGALPVSLTAGDCVTVDTQRVFTRSHAPWAAMWVQTWEFITRERVLSAHPRKPLQAKRNQLLPGGKTPGLMS